MGNSECRCLPDGGGTKCPPQHIAMCIKGTDRHCYGECIPIPLSYSFASSEFLYWMDNSIMKNFGEYIKRNFADRIYYTDDDPERINKQNFEKGGTTVFNVNGIGNFRVRYSYEFINERPGSGLLMNYNESIL